jgi:hypothetical protein
MKNLALIAIALAFLSGSVHSESLNNYLDFYVGADAQLRVTKFKKGFGDNLLRKHYPQGNIYTGFSLSENIGLEVGYESTTERSCDATLVNGQCCAARHIPNVLSPAIFKTKIRIKGPHIGLVLFYPLENYPVKLLGSLGVSAVKGTVEIKGIALGNPPIPGTVRTLSKHKEALRIMGGAQYLTEMGLGFRGSMSFIRTRKIVIKKSDAHPSIQIPMIKLRDSIAYGLGAFWVF